MKVIHVFLWKSLKEEKNIRFFGFFIDFATSVAIYSSFLFYYPLFAASVPSFDSIINDFQVHFKVVKHLIWSFLRCHLNFLIRNFRIGRWT